VNYAGALKGQEWLVSLAKSSSRLQNDLVSSLNMSLAASMSLPDASSIAMSKVCRSLSARTCDISGDGGAAPLLLVGLGATHRRDQLFRLRRWLFLQSQPSLRFGTGM
jgi:hypothetical protein